MTTPKHKCLLTVLIILCFQIGSTGSVLAETKSWAIKGKAVTTDGIKDGWLVIEDGVIRKVGAAVDELPNGVKQIEWNQYIFPGLIDSHNHSKWNSIPQWTHGPFKNRYEWQDESNYKNTVEAAYNKLGEYNSKEISQKYAEVRAIMGGTTMIQGSYYELQPNYLCRNLDERYKTFNQVENLATADADELKKRVDGLNSGKYKRVFIHLAEGHSSDNTSQNEFQLLKDKGFFRKGVVIIHGLALNETDYKEMSEKNIPLVWSPVSNWNLYRDIVDIQAALKAGLVVSLAPDWTISGSDNLLEEMKFAYAIGRAKWGKLITPKLLFEMTTLNAAKVCGLDKNTIAVGAPMGQLAAGYAADLFLAPKLDSGQNSSDDPFESLLRTYPKHIHLVFIDGIPMYGDRQALKELVGKIDDITVQNTPKAIAQTKTYDKDKSNQLRYRKIEKSLEKALPELAPLVEN